MKINKIIIFSLIMAISIFGCDGGTDEIIPELIIDPIIEPITETEPEPETVCNMKAIKTFPNYFYTDGAHLYGIDGQTTERIKVLDLDGKQMYISNFYTTIENSETVLFFIIRDSIYKQESDKISEVLYEPSHRDIARSIFTSDDFTIEEIDYEGAPYSDVTNVKMSINGNTYFNRVHMINGYALFDDGLLYNVFDGMNAVSEGLYFWPIDSTNVQIIINAKGILY